MRRQFLGSLLAGTLLVSCVPVAEAAGPFGRTLIGRRPPILPILPPLPRPGGGGGGGDTSGGGGTGGGGGYVGGGGGGGLIGGGGGGGLIGGGGGGNGGGGGLLGRSTTITTTTTTANLNITSNSETVGVAGSCVYQTVTMSTTMMGFTYTTSSSTLSGHISRTPTVDNDVVDFVLYYAGVGSARHLASVNLDSAGNGSFNLSEANGAPLPHILQGDVVYANCVIEGQPVTLKIGRFGASSTTTTAY